MSHQYTKIFFFFSCLLFLAVFLFESKPALANCYPSTFLGCEIGGGRTCTNNPAMCSTTSSSEACCTAAPATPSNPDCTWTLLNNTNSPYHGMPAYCVGGFNSEQELRSSSVTFSCTGLWCGGWAGRAWNWITGSDTQEYALNSAGEIGQSPDGKYFTCLTGDFDSSIEGAIRDQVQDLGPQCALATVAIALSPPITALAIIPIRATLVGTGCAAIVPILRTQVTPSLSGVTTGPSGSCQDTMRVTLGVDGDVEPVDEDVVPLGTTEICTFVSNLSERQACDQCFKLPGIWTPFGCIESNPQLFVEKILRIAIGIAGGIAFLMIVYGGLVIMMAAGNPEKLNEGREIVTSAISGLLLIVFSVIILRIIGVDILGIPGLA